MPSLEVAHLCTGPEVLEELDVFERDVGILLGGDNDEASGAGWARVQVDSRDVVHLPPKVLTGVGDGDVRVMPGHLSGNGLPAAGEAEKSPREDPRGSGRAQKVDEGKLLWPHRRGDR